MAVHIVLKNANIIKIKNINRQLDIKITPAPSSGAIAGTIANIIIIKDEMRAISRPE